jgi:hypothetical protein
MAFTHIKKVNVGPFIKARIRSWSLLPEPDPTKKVRIQPDPQHCRYHPTILSHHLTFSETVPLPTLKACNFDIV